MMTGTLTRILVVVLMSTVAAGQQQVDVHIYPVTTQVLTPQQEEDFLGAAIFGQRYYAAGDLPSALDQLQTADEIVPGHPAILYNTALILLKLGRFADAQNKIDTYRALYPDGNESPLIRALHIDLQWIRDAQKRSQQNQTYIELFNRAKFAFGSGNFDEALELFRRAQQERPEDAPAAFNQAVCLEAVGDYSGAIERLRHFLSLGAGAGERSSVDDKINLLGAEVSDQRNSIVCSFCGQKLPGSGIWCPDCAHGPFSSGSSQWNSRSCSTGATATRSTFYASGRLFQNEDLSCLYQGSYQEALRYSTPKRLAIQGARKAEGWTFKEGRISSFTDRDDTIVLKHENGSLSRIISPAAGDWLEFSGSRSAEGSWQLASEDRIIEGQRYRKQYTYDEAGRISRETVRYQGANRCGHIIETTADWVYEGDRLKNVMIAGGYEGYPSEGTPKVSWKGNVSFTYDVKGRLLQEELTIESFEKAYTRLPGDVRSLVANNYASSRRGRNIDLIQKGDICGTAGTQLIQNAIDLRPFDSWSPNLAIALPPGVTRASVAFTYSDDYSLE